MGSLQTSSTNLSRSSFSCCIPLPFGSGMGLGENDPIFGFLTILGLVGKDLYEELDDDDDFFWIRGE